MANTAIDMLRDYVRAFESLQGERVVPFYLLPCTFIRPDGTWVVQDESTALVLANHMIEHARSQGYHRTKTVGAHGRMLAANLQELTGTFVRYNAAGEAIARLGFTYVVRLTDAGWRIIVAAAHDADAGAEP